MSEIEPDRHRPEADANARPLTGEPVAPMRLRPEPPRVTRLSRKVLIALGLLAGTGIGGTLIYALQTRHGGKTNEELYSTDNRTTPDGLAALPKDYAGVPKLGPPLPGDLGRPILSAQNAGQPVPTPGIATPNPGISQEEQRRIQHQPDRPADRAAPAQHRADTDHPTGLPRPRDRHPRSRS